MSATRKEILIAPTRDTYANWSQSTVIIPEGVLCVETDTGKFKIGNGTSTYANLKYIGGNIYAGSATDQEISALINPGDLYIR